MKQSEGILLKQIQLACADMAKLFRNNTGLGWIGETRRAAHGTTVTITLYPGDVVIRNARPLHAGLVKGGSDLIGWDNQGLFTAIECKTGRQQPTDEQQSFINAVRLNGGKAGVARSVVDAIKILTNEEIKNPG